MFQHAAHDAVGTSAVFVDLVQIAGKSARQVIQLSATGLIQYRETRRRGYAMNRGEWASEASVTAIGFPIRIGEHAIGAINLVLQNNVVSDREVAIRYVPLLRQLADDISKATSSAPRG